MGEVMGEETVEEMERETVCIAGAAGSAEDMPGHQSPAEQETRTLVNGGHKPLYQ